MSRLSPFYRLLFFLFLVLSVFFADSFFSNLIVLLIVSAAFMFSKTGLDDLFMPVFKLRYFLLFIFLLNALLSKEGTLFSFFIFRLSRDGLINAFLIVYRVSLITLIAYLYTSESTISEINDSLYILLLPLKLLFIPVDMISSAISISLSLIDEFIGESERLRKVRKLRRTGMPDNTFKERILDYKAIVIPIFIMAFKRADELSFALESRGYSAQMSVRREYLKIGIRELVAVLSILSVFVLLVSGGIR